MIPMIIGPFWGKAVTNKLTQAAAANAADSTVVTREESYDAPSPPLLPGTTMTTGTATTMAINTDKDTGTNDNDTVIGPVHVPIADDLPTTNKEIKKY